MPNEFNIKKKFNWQFLGKKKPIVFTALLTQDDVDAPTMVVLENTIGSEPSLSYDGVGQYSLTFGSNNVMPAGKTTVSIGNNIVTGALASVLSNTFRINIFTFSAVDATPGDTALLNTPIKVIVYP